MTDSLASALSVAPLLLSFCFVSAAGAQEVLPASARAESPKLNLDQVLTKLEERNAKRAAELQQFDGKRIYRMQYRGLFKGRDAEMVVKVRFVAPNSKQFTVVSETGSRFVIDHVFKKLLDAEKEASTGDNRRGLSSFFACGRTVLRNDFGSTLFFLIRLIAFPGPHRRTVFRNNSMPFRSSATIC